MSKNSLAETIESMALPLCRRYEVVHFGSLAIQVQEGGATCSSKRIVWALGVLSDGQHESMGAWPQAGTVTELWASVFEDLRRRGVEAVDFVCSDDAVEIQPFIDAQFPRAKVRYFQAPLKRRAPVWTVHAVEKMQRSALRSVRRFGLFTDMPGAAVFALRDVRRAERALARRRALAHPVA